MSKRHPDFDYEAEGLLSDVHDDAGRDARTRLLDYLIDDERISLIDVLVYQETVRRGRRAFLDFTRNPTDPAGRERWPEVGS